MNNDSNLSVQFWAVNYDKYIHFWKPIKVYYLVIEGDNKKIAQ